MSGLPEAVAAFPRRYAESQRFGLGHPRTIRVSPDGRRVVFLRAAAGDKPATGLWVLDTTTGEQTQVGDPDVLETDGPRLTDEERVRRERAREGAAGVTSYATDDAVQTVAFQVGGLLYTADLDKASLTPIPLPDPIAAPHPSPDGTRIAFVADAAVHVIDADGAVATRLIGGEDDDTVTWGLPEFVAAEEMHRFRGFWWSPDSTTLAVARVDTAPVQRWYLSSPVDPGSPPVAVAYPSAGTPNADVTLHLVPLDGGTVIDVKWDRDTFPYLADVVWDGNGPLTLVVQTRDQKTLRYLTVDTATGATDSLREVHDTHWVELVPGSPRWTPSGELLYAADVDDTRSLALGERVLTPPGLQVRAILGLTEDAAIVTASEEPTAVGVWRVPLRGQEEATLLSDPRGVATAAVGGDTLVLSQRLLTEPGMTVRATAPDAAFTLASNALAADLPVRATIHKAGRRQLRSALVLPSWWRDGDAPLPVLLDPYGGPHAQRVLASHDAYLVSQWFAEQGFAVLVTDGRGSPGRGLAWERAVAGDLAGPVLEDQIDALRAVAAVNPALDTARVAIRGWSFGGHLAALAATRAPEVFAAAVVGAPVTEQALYDTHYTERYLGMPQEQPEAYARSSVLPLPELKPEQRRPMLIIHGLADDNVVVAHSLRLSRALLEAGHPHQVLPLSGVSHMTPQAAVSENLLYLELAFLRNALGLPEQER